MDADLIILNLMAARNETLRTGPPATRDEHGWTPLHAAVAFNDPRRVEELLVDNVGKTLLEASNNDGWTPLHAAAALNGNPRAAALSDHDENDSGLTVLEKLLEKHADRNARNKDGWTPLHVAAALNHNAQVVRKLLCGSGAPSSGVKDKKGRTPLHVAAANNSSPGVMKLLLKSPGANANARANDYSTPLHQAAAKAKNPEIMRLLVKCDGPELNARNKAGCTPLHRAAKKTKSREIVRLLLEYGADPRLQNEKGELPVDLADKNKKLQGTEVYWQLRDGRYLAHKNWDDTKAAGTKEQSGGNTKEGKDDDGKPRTHGSGNAQ